MVSDKVYGMYVALMENGEPVSVIPFREWIEIPVNERPDNGHIVIACDELDAYLQARDGKFIGEALKEQPYD